MQGQELIAIDGSTGEGGGQIIRSSLALSMITGKEFRIANIRGRRKKPGLLRQHLTAVKLAARVCNANIEGAELGSSSLLFSPSVVQAGDYRADIGTAGSCTLVLQTVIPPLMSLATKSSVRVTGGTHNGKAPPADYLCRAFLPLLSRIGPACELKLNRYGFYPAGGGEIELKIDPENQLHGLKLLEKKGKPKITVTAIVSALDKSIAERECDSIRRKSNWRRASYQALAVEQPSGPGNVVIIEVAYENVTEVFIEFGKIGIRAEQVAKRAMRQAAVYLDNPAPVGEYLADQLLLPLALAAVQGSPSEFRTFPLSQHSHTQIETIQRFLDVNIAVSNDIVRVG